MKTIKLLLLLAIAISSCSSPTTYDILIKNGISHFKASALLVLLNIVIVTLCIWLSFTFESEMMLFFLLMIFCLYLVLFNVLRKKSNQNLISDSK